MTTPRVALVLAAVHNLSGSGGTERQFADLFEYLRGQTPSTVQLISARVALHRLQAAGRLPDGGDVIALPLGDRPARGKLGVAWLTLCLLWVTFRHRWDVVHLCQPTPAYLPYASVVSRVPRAWRPRLSLTVVDCTLAPNVASGVPPGDLYEQQVIDAHRMYFRWSRLDGVFTWYEAFGQVAASLGLAAGVLTVAAKYCFTDPRRFMPSSKQPIVVYAGRLSHQKRPLLFVDAVGSFVRRFPDLAAGWRFEMYGAGPLEVEVRSRIGQLGLSDRVVLTSTPDLAPVFAGTRLFVSTQAHENFTSLAMLEAMAAGNAVVAERIGQTAEFVKDGENGYLVSPPTPDNFADAIARYVTSADHARMAEASRAMTLQVHTIEQFADDIGAFWRALAAM